MVTSQITTRVGEVVSSTVDKINILKKNQNAPRPSERPPVRGGKMPKRLCGIKGCKYKIKMFILSSVAESVRT